MTCEHKLDIEDCLECMPSHGPVENKKEFPHMEEALLAGGEMSVFRSGGGLRVVRIDGGPVDGYGEAPQFEEALEHCEYSLSKGGQTYAQMYSGKGAKFTHYLTGTTEKSSELDGAILRGNSFRAWAVSSVGGKEGKSPKKIWVQIKSYEEFEYPEGMHERVIRTQKAEEFEDRGYTYLVYPSKFPNGELCTGAKVLSSPEGRAHHRAWMYRVKQTVCGDSGLYELLLQALSAPKEELMDE